MPRRLLDLCQPDSIREFRASARERYDDGLALAAAGRRTGAIYLWGYAAEMILKGAYFTFQIVPEVDVITVQGHIQGAINKAQATPLLIAWPKTGAGHNVRAWAELLVAERALTPATAYAPPFGQEVQRCGQQVGQLWREFLRYHKNFAYRYEVRQVREAVEWLLVNAVDLSGPEHASDKTRS